MTRGEALYMHSLELTNQRLRKRIKEQEQFLNWVILYTLIKDKIMIPVEEILLQDGTVLKVAGGKISSGWFFSCDRISKHPQYDYLDIDDPMIAELIVGAEIGDYIVINAAWGSAGNMGANILHKDSFKETYGRLFTKEPTKKVSVGTVKVLAKPVRRDENDKSGFTEIKKGLFVLMDNPLQWVDIETLVLNGQVKPIVTELG